MKRLTTVPKVEESNVIRTLLATDISLLQDWRRTWKQMYEQIVTQTRIYTKTVFFGVINQLNDPDKRFERFDPFRWKTVFSSLID